MIWPHPHTFVRVGAWKKGLDPASARLAVYLRRPECTCTNNKHSRLEKDLRSLNLVLGGCAIR